MGHESAVAWLREQGLDPCDLTTIVGRLQKQAREIDAMDWLRMKGFDLRAVPSNRSVLVPGDTTAMHEASRCGKLAVCRFLFELGAVDEIRIKDDDLGFTPMHNACSGGHLDVAKWLFEAGAAGDIRAKDNDGYTPMHGA